MGDPALELPLICSAEVVRRIRAGEPVKIWIREKFACRQDDHVVRVRYAADGSAGPVRIVNAADVSPRLRSLSYCTHAARHMPRVLSRLTLSASLKTDG